jgi:outer membrane protein OmpA-like peptidoglycan-associated protein
MTFKTTTIAIVSAAVLITGCSMLNRTAKGTVIGAGAGGVAGAIAGKYFGDTAKGAIIGAAVGGATGAIIGRRMDNQAEELAKSIENARIDRLGEGIAITFESGLLFGFDSAVLQNEAKENLNKLAASLKTYPDSDLMIVGHTDNVGSESYNMELSSRRSAAATSYLLSQGIASSRIRTDGRGEIEPIATNDTDAGRKENRRIEVAIFASPDYVQRVQNLN